MKNGTETIAFYLTLLKNVMYAFKYREPDLFAKLISDGNYVVYTFSKTRIKEVENNTPKIKGFVNRNLRLPSQTELECILDEHCKEDKYL